MQEVSTHLQDRLTVILACSRSTKDEMMGSALTPSMTLCMIPAPPRGTPCQQLTLHECCAALDSNNRAMPMHERRCKTMV